MERCQSGLMGHGANVLSSQGLPGFESLPLRLRLAVARLRRDAVRRSRAKAGNKIMHYIYSLKCKDGYYIGCTDNIKDRLERHRKGQVPATAERLPVNLEFYFVVRNKYQAFEFEKYLKSGSGRAFINKHLI